MLTNIIAFVQRVKRVQGGNYNLEVLWVYELSDTSCMSMNYPHQNELFLSDDCNCGTTLRLKDVVSVVPIEVMLKQKSLPTEQYFIRQKYCTENSAFVSLCESDFTCTHYGTASIAETYQSGDTILTHEDGKPLEPVIFRGYTGEAGARVQVLQRRSSIEEGSDIKPNELVWTNIYLSVSKTNLIRRCHIKFLRPDETPPTPYDRDGQGDCFFLSSRLRNGALEPLNNPMSRTEDWFNEGFDPNANIPKLLSLSVFSGGGNFDRGLEEGGILKTVHAIEMDGHAAHTYGANSPSLVKIFRGSVDDYLSNAIKGDKETANVGNINCVCGGSPCTGLSCMQENPESPRSKVNTSKVASLASLIDLYRPEYAILENVVAMSRPIGGDKSKSVLAQLICTFVAMGYQVQQHVLCAANYGGPQTRDRLFITLTAPGLKPMDRPPHTHSVPPRHTRSLSITNSGGLISDSNTPFKGVTAKDSTKDLPNLGRGVIPCIEYPEHRVVGRMSTVDHLIYEAIPSHHMYPQDVTKPVRSTLSRAAHAGLLNDFAQAYWDKLHDFRKSYNSNAFRKLRDDDFFLTVHTSYSPNDAKAGSPLHWSEPRRLSLMEVRRAQGFLDNELLIGPDAEKWKIVGNSVSRQVALALGLRLRHAWMSNSAEQRAIVLARVRDVGLDEDGDDLGLTRYGRRVLPVRLASGSNARQSACRVDDDANGDDDEDLEQTRPVRRRLFKRADANPTLDNRAVEQSSTDARNDIEIIEISD
jgi:DNA (cytosine-5)-methyltransferase 1